MASIASRLDWMEARLVYLEKRDLTNTKEMAKLKDENVELRTKVEDLKRENASAMEKLKEYDAKIDEMKSVTDKMSGFKENVDTGLCKIDENIKKMKSLTDTMSGSNEKVESRLSKMDANLKETTGHLTRELGVVRNVQKVFNRMVVKQHENEMTKTIKELQDKVKALDKIDYTKKSSMFHSFIKPSKPLVAKTWTRCNDCVMLRFPGVNFQKDSCTYEVAERGLYGFDVYLLQEGQGQMRTRIRFDDNPVSCYGCTSSGQDEVHDFMALYLSKGDKVCVEIMQEEGDAQVLVCVFSGLLIL